MEIPIINRISEFEPLNNPSLISRLLSSSSTLPHRIWKWGALFLALLYAFSRLAYKIKLLILHYHNKSKSLLSSASDPLLYSHFDSLSSTSDDDVDDDVASTSDDDVAAAAADDDDDDFSFSVKGGWGDCNSGEKCSLKLRRRRIGGNKLSISDLVEGNGVVKLWENSILGEIPAVSVSPAVVFSAGGGGDDGILGLGLWDLRMNRRKPAVRAQWRSNRRGNTVGVDSGRTGKVYLRDDVGLRVGDVRKLDSPLKDLTEFEEDMWWDANGVVTVNES